MAKKKIELSEKTQKAVTAAGGLSEYRMVAGYLPSDYWQRPLYYADKLNKKSKARVRRMVTGLLAERKGRKPYTFEVSNYLMENVGFK